MHPKTGMIVHCCPPKHAPELEGDEPMACPAIVCGVFDQTIAVHYFLPDGANGSCELPREDAGIPTAGRWWST